MMTTNLERARTWLESPGIITDTGLAALLDEVEACGAAAAHRELERWRHGTPVEGDYLCPDSLERDALHAQVARLRAALQKIIRADVLEDDWIKAIARAALDAEGRDDTQKARRKRK